MKARFINLIRDIHISYLEFKRTPKVSNLRKKLFMEGFTLEELHEYSDELEKKGVIIVRVSTIVSAICLLVTVGVVVVSLV